MKKDLEQFVRKRKYLFWSTKEISKLSREAVVEGILNYGDWEDVEGLIEIMGIEEVARIFRAQIKKKRVNYKDKVANYFKLYFAKYAPGVIEQKSD